MITTSTRYKRGDVREDGKVLWGLQTNKKTGKADREWWIEPDQLQLAYCRRIYSAAKQRAKVLNLPFDISPEYLLSIMPHNLVCPIMDYKMELFGGRNRSPSLDKIIPDNGYTKGNVVWMSLEANRIKDNATLSILKRLVELIERNGQEPA